MPFFENLVNMVFYTFILEMDYRSQNTPIFFKLINYNMRYITFKFLTVPAQNISVEIPCGCFYLHDFGGNFQFLEYKFDFRSFIMRNSACPKDFRKY